MKSRSFLWANIALISWLSSLFLPLYSDAVESYPKFHHITIDQGLSQNSVLCILQDMRGFMWFGTWDGLNRYDGYNFKVYRYKPQDSHSLSSNAVYVLYEDRQGTLWAGLQQGGGLNKYHREKDQWIHYQHDPKNPHSLSHNDVFAIYGDQQGALWVGTANGLNRLDPTTGRFTRYYNVPEDPQSLSSNKVVTIYEDRSGKLWLGTANGLNRFEQTTKQFTRFQTNPKNPQSLSHHEVFVLYEDREGTLWVGTTGGLNRFDRETQQFTRYRYHPAKPHGLGYDRISAIYEDHTGSLWIGTYGGGIDIFDRETEQFFHYRNVPDNSDSIGGNIVSTLYEDRSGVMWVGTEGEGVSFYDPQQEKFRHYFAEPGNPENSLSTNYVRAFYEDQDQMLWIGTYGGGLNKFDRRSQQWTHYRASPTDPQSLSHDVVLALCEDRQGTFWLGTQKGLQQLDRKTGKFSGLLIYNYVRTIYEDRGGMLWVGTISGLSRFDPVTRKFVHYRANPADPHSLSHDVILSIHEDQRGTLWVGTYEGGLNRFDRAREQFTHYRADPMNPTSLSHDIVTAIHEDRQGILWVATAGGLNQFDQSHERFTHYTDENGLPNNTIYGLLEDQQGYLWLSSNRGLSKFDPRTHRIRNYDVTDGLQSNEFNGGAFYQSRRGEMFFGGINGFNAFYPEDLKDNPYRPPIVITDFQIFNTSVLPADEQSNRSSPLKHIITETDAMTLSYKDAVFSFEFAALHYTLPEHNHYAYMMEGVDKDWNYVENRRFATYTKLPGGKYTFHVKGSNSDGVWNEKGVSLAITVTPPPWKTWWAYCLYGLGVCSIFVGYIQYKRWQYIRERKILDRFVPYEFLSFLNQKSVLNVQLGDHISEKMAIMFSDIRSFTTFAEKMTSKENFDFLNAYLSRMGPIIRQHHGFIDKYIGDAIMALFPGQIEQAVNASIAMMKQLSEYNTQRQQSGDEPINIGIGLHIGQVMLGTIGEAERMDGTVIADAVNVASRLEGLTKYYGVSILISGETFEALSNREQYHIRFLDNVAVKGKEQPITIYEVFDANPEDQFHKKLQILPDFEEGQRLYFDRQFEKALQRFKSVLAVIPDDLTTHLYIERCEHYIKEGGVAEGWDGVQKMDKK